ISPSENCAEGGANGNVFSTSTSESGRSGLGNAYRSVMSAIGSATARGPETWWDIACPRRPVLARAGLVGSLFEQRLQRRVLQSLGGRGIVEHPLERVVHAQGLADLLDGAG